MVDQPPLPPFLAELERRDPEFARLVLALRARTHYTAGALDVKTKLLIAFALDVAAGQTLGASILADRARSAGATEAELLEAVEVCASVGTLQALSAGLRVLGSQ